MKKYVIAAIIAIEIASISFGEIRNINIAMTTVVPSQILRPSEAPIPSSTKIAIKAVKILVNGYQSLQKLSETKSGNDSSKNPP